MIREIQFSPSTFIIDNDDTHLFSKDVQADYRKRSALAIGRALKKVEMCEKSEEKLSDLFFEILGDFGAARKEIAELHNRGDAKGFGERRMSFRGDCSTPFDDVYKPYNERIVAEFKDLLEPYREELTKRVHEKIKFSVWNTAEGDTSSFEVEVFDEDEVTALSELTSIETPKDFPDELLVAKELDSENFEVLRRAYESLYDSQFEKATKIDLANYIRTLHQRYPYIRKGVWGDLRVNDANLKSFYALGTVRFTVNGKSTVVSQYLIWLHRDGKMHPLDRMRRHTISTVIHQPAFLINPTLKEVSRLFAKAILWNKQQVKELKEYVGLFRAYFTHACCFYRGSASIGEYFETLLYHYQGFRLQYSNKKLVDLEAFATPLLSEFLANYHSMVRID